MVSLETIHISGGCHASLLGYIMVYLILSEHKYPKNPWFPKKNLDHGWLNLDICLNLLEVDDFAIPQY